MENEIKIICKVELFENVTRQEVENIIKEFQITRIKYNALGDYTKENLVTFEDVYNALKDEEKDFAVSTTCFFENTTTLSSAFKNALRYYLSRKPDLDLSDYDIDECDYYGNDE
jgi:hypothetical protein